MFRPPATSPRARWALLAAGSLALPLVANEYWLLVANRALITVIAGVGLAILSGSTGQLSVAQGAFMAVGGYAAAIGATELGLAIIPATGFAVAIAIAFGTLVALPALRLDSLYLGVATLALHVALVYLIRHLDVTGGSVGLQLPTSSIGAWRIDDRIDVYALLLVAAALTVTAAARLLRSRTGRALMAIRDSDMAAAALGVHVTRFRVFAFALSAALGALAGAIDAFASHTITPDSYPLTLSIQLLTVVIVGGMGSLGGAVVAAVVLSFIPEALRVLTSALQDVLPRLADQVLAVQTGIYGAVLVAVLVWKPGGLAGWWRQRRSVEAGPEGADLDSRVVDHSIRALIGPHTALEEQ